MNLFDKTTCLFLCRGGCCPGVFGWFCCPGGEYCAITAADCPNFARKQLLALMGVGNGCDGMNCKHGCCANLIGFYCCPKAE